LYKISQQEKFLKIQWDWKTVFCGKLCSYGTYIWPVGYDTNFDEIKNYIEYQGNHKVNKSCN
jgi:hypothetical protein